MVKRQKEAIAEELVPKECDIQGELDKAAADMTDDLTTEIPIDRELALAESIRLLGRTDDIDTLSELENEEICALCTISMMADEFDIPVLDDLRENFIKFRVSKARKGRKGIEDILKSVMNEKETMFGKLQNRMNSWMG